MNEWHVPMPPEQRDANALRRRRYGWGAAGGAVGLLGVAATLLLFVGPMMDQRTQDLAYTGVGVLLLSGVLTVVLLLIGGLLTIVREVRPFAVGMLIGTAVGLICTNGVCFAVVASL